MDERLILSLDAMGGDNAPAAVVRGMQLALPRLPHVDFLLFGDREKLAPLLDADPGVKSRVEIRHTDQVVSSDDKPSRVLRTGRQSSMWLAVDAVARGEAKAAVSAGNTGALMVVSKFLLRMLPGIARPALVQMLPTERGRTVMLDLGANVACDANNLVEFAIMGQAFARIVLNLERPTVGLLDMRADASDGDETVRAAASILGQGLLPVDFHGCIDGHDILAGTVDVVVTNGFAGNIALKTIEGTARLYLRFLRAAVAASWTAPLGYLLARRSLLKVKQQTDSRNYEGGMFLGLDGIAIKSHGGTDALGFATAIGTAAKLASLGINERIKTEMAAFHPPPDTAPGASDSPEPGISEPDRPGSSG